MPQGLWPCPALGGYEIHAGVTVPEDIAARRTADLERLADAVEAALDWTKLASLLPSVGDLQAKSAATASGLAGK